MAKGSEIGSSLEKIIEDAKIIERGNKFNLEDLQKGEWSELYIFGPYTPTSAIEKKIGTTNDTLKEVDIEGRDDINLLIFMLQKKVVDIVPYPRQKLDFSPIASGAPIRREATFFNIVESVDEKGWFYAELAK